MKRRLTALLLALATASVGTAAPRVPQDDIDSTSRLTSGFLNSSGSKTNTGAITAFSGHIGANTTDGAVFLQRSAIGVPAQSMTFSDAAVEETINSVRAKLYYEDATGSGDDTPENAAFRYRALLFQHDDTDDDGTPNPEAPIRANYDMMADWYGEAERARALEAERTIRNALIGDPLNEELQIALLDLFYDRAVAELQFVKIQLDELNRLKLDIISGAPPDSTIPMEIALWTDEGGILDTYRVILDQYGELLNDPFAFKISEFDSSQSSGTPLGYYAFQKNVPNLKGMAGQYINSEGEVEFVPSEGADPLPDYPELYKGYRELVLLMSVLGDYNEGLSEAAYLLFQNSDPENPDDPNLEMANELISEGYNVSHFNGELLLGMFPDLDPQDFPDSGLRASIDRWQTGIANLTEVRRIIDGDLNPLGFQPDFLILTTGFQSGQDEFFDSYNTLATWISELTDPPIRPLAVAQSEFERAQNRYLDYRGYEDQLDEQMFNVLRDFDDRAFQLVGAVPGEPGYNPGSPTVGLIADQRVSIELARTRIEENGVRINNVYAEIQNEIERRGIEAGVNNAIEQVQIEYGNMRADLREEIGDWRAAQATSQGISDMIGNMFTAGPFGVGAAVFAGVLGVVNVGVQTGAELSIAEKEGQLERLAGLEDAAITSLNDQILDANSAALVKNLTLNLATLAVESKQAELSLRQEMVRLSTLYNELAQIENFYNDDAQFASERFFSDPLHYLRAQESVQRASETFREAQDWLFFTARALEYKWNQPFRRTVGERTWSIDELFRTRNSRELSQMLAAMELYDGAQSFGPGTGTNSDSISLREDLLGYRDLGNNSEALFYPDPVTGELVRAKDAFRSYLNANTVTRDNGDRAVSIVFGTAFSPPGSQFFLGPEFDNQGTPTELGTWLDKIQWIKINVPGNMSGGGFINGFLSDGGAQLIRQGTVGTFNPDMPQLVKDEFTAYSSRLWFTQDGGESFEFRESLRAPIRMELGLPAGTTTLPDVPENTFFKERSVANTRWNLEFTIFDADGSPGGLDLLNLEQVDDIEVIINHRFTPRL